MDSKYKLLETEVKDKYGFTSTVMANQKGYNILYADYSEERFECEDSTENNFDRAMNYLIRIGLIDERTAEELSMPIKAREGDKE